MVDDPGCFGRIAAANALSDIYAMGARPLTVMNLVGFPACLEQVPGGGRVLFGGQTVEDDEPKFGLAVTGIVDPKNLVSTVGALPGDRLVLTKPLGTGMLATSLNWVVISETQMQHAIRGMEQLNRYAAEAMLSVGVHACTDITGFGLLGHALELAEASRVGLEIEPGSLQVYPEVPDLAAIGLVPAGSYHNRQHYLPHVVDGELLPPEIIDILADPQTSGGLLICVAENKLAWLCRELEAKGSNAFVIGRVVEQNPGKLKVRI